MKTKTKKTHKTTKNKQQQQTTQNKKKATSKNPLKKPRLRAQKGKEAFAKGKVNHLKEDEEFRESIFLFL